MTEYHVDDPVMNICFIEDWITDGRLFLPRVSGSRHDALRKHARSGPRYIAALLPPQFLVSIAIDRGQQPRCRKPHTTMSTSLNTTGVDESTKLPSFPNPQPDWSQDDPSHPGFVTNGLDNTPGRKAYYILPKQSSAKKICSRNSCMISTMAWIKNLKPGLGLP